MNIQKMSKNKEVQADYKLRAFIIFLFVVIICVLKFAHVYYDRHVLQVSRKIKIQYIPIIYYKIQTTYNIILPLHQKKKNRK